MMATNKQIQIWVHNEYGYQPKTCWIAHCKELSGLPVKRSHRRSGEKVYPCPEGKLGDFQYAFQHFGMLVKDVTIVKERLWITRNQLRKKLNISFRTDSFYLVY
jgi:hypothetical protein